MLPADCPLGILLPSMIDLALPGSHPVTDPQRWHLNRLGGQRLDTSMTLQESAVDDGELLLLTTAPSPVPHHRPRDPSGVVAGAAHPGPSVVVRAAAGPVVAIVGAATLAWSGSTGGTSAHLWTAAALAAATATGAVAFGRTAREMSVVLSLAAVLLAAALGVTVVSAVALTGAVSPVIATLLAADVGLLLLLRQRSHIDGRRRIVSGAAGLCALIAAHIVTVGVSPQHAPWLCTATVIAGVSALHRAASTAAPTPVIRQGVQILEYLALAAVIPLAAWVTGVFGLVRNLSLS